MDMNKFILNHFFFCAVLLFGFFINLIVVGGLFFTGSSTLWLRGNSPWDFYIPCIIATFIDMGYSAWLDRNKGNLKYSVISISLNLYAIFCLSSVFLYLLIHIFIGLNNSRSVLYIVNSFGSNLERLLIFIIAGIPCSLTLGGIGFIFKNRLIRHLISSDKKDT